MSSVTHRIKRVTQPTGGYLKPRMMDVIQLKDRKRTYVVTSKYKAIQGIAVDYLTRFMSGTPVEQAFGISLAGARIVRDAKHALQLLQGIRGLDKRSIINACRLTGYDIAFRDSPAKFIPVDRIDPSDEVIHNIRVFVQRSLSFLEANGPIVLNGATFEGGYTHIVSSGDCDFVTADTLWDLKVSSTKPTSAHTLQLLIYYILGLHSVHNEFQYIRSLGIYNPELNRAYTIAVSSIPDKVYQAVSRDVIGYHTPDDPHDWRLASWTDPAVLMRAAFDSARNFVDTGFRPDHYEDGIYDISLDDYWSYWKTIRTSDGDRPKFPYTHSVKFLKRDGFSMFFSISEKGTASLLYGGKRTSLDFPVEYYYDNMARYGRIVLTRFAKYWDALYDISRLVQAIPADPEAVRKTAYADYVKKMERFGFPPTDFDRWWAAHKEQHHLTGCVHGCIIDLDFSSHLYLNPYDGTVASYFALSEQDKLVYPNVASLLSAHRPEMLPGLQALAAAVPTELVAASSAIPQALISFTDTAIHAEGVPVSDTSMYPLSKRLAVLQMIRDHHYIGKWYNHLLDESTSTLGVPQLHSGKDETL